MCCNLIASLVMISKSQIARLEKCMYPFTPTGIHLSTFILERGYQTISEHSIGPHKYLKLQKL